MRVVFHLNNIENYQNTMSNIKNILKLDIDQVILLINGTAITLFKNTDYDPKINDKRFRIMACQNSMKSQDVDEDDLFPNAKSVSSGVYTLVELQHKGFAYIKP